MAQRHDGVRNLLTSLIGKVCTNAEIEPQLQQQQQQQQHFISPHNIQEIKIYNNSTDDDRGAGCPK